MRSAVRIARGKARALGRELRHGDAHLAEGFFDDGAAGEDAGLTRDDGHAQRCLRRDRGLGRDIAPRRILAQGRGDRSTDGLGS